MTWLYTPEGERELNALGHPVRRPTDSPTPCVNCPKIPKGFPATRFQAVELSLRERVAWDFYKRCRAVGRWPHDEVVELFAKVADEVHRACDRQQDRAGQWMAVEGVAKALMASAAAAVSGADKPRGIYDHGR